MIYSDHASETYFYRCLVERQFLCFYKEISLDSNMSGIDELISNSLTNVIKKNLEPNIEKKVKLSLFKSLASIKHHQQYVSQQMKAQWNRIPKIIASTLYIIFYTYC